MKKVALLGVGMILLCDASEHPRPTGNDDRPAKRPRTERAERGIQERRNQALLEAVQNGNVQLAQVLISNGAEVNTVDADGLTLLMQVSYDGNAEMVGVLLSAGADVERRDSDGATALLIAAAQNHIVVVQQLINKGTDVNSMNWTGWSALLFAAQNQNIPLVKLLLTNKARLPTLEEMGRVGLSQAARQLLERYKHLYQPYQLKEFGVGG